MSSTARGGIRNVADNYPTPGWTVHRLLEKCKLPAGHWLEPGGGEGSIIRAANEYRTDITWWSTELREEARDHLTTAVGSPDRVSIGNYLEGPLTFPVATPRFAAALGNPPFRLAREFIERSLLYADNVVMLLRLNFLGSDARCEWMQKSPPDCYVLPNRPPFRGSGSDSIEYAWMHWEGFKQRGFGLFRVLNTTPLDVRKEYKRLQIYAKSDLETIAAEIAGAIMDPSSTSLDSSYDHGDHDVG